MERLKNAILRFNFWWYMHNAKQPVHQPLESWLEAIEDDTFS